MNIFDMNGLKNHYVKIRIIIKQNIGGSIIMKSENVKKGALKVIAKVVEIGVKEYVYEWPPHCAGILHQPKRPMECRSEKEK